MESELICLDSSVLIDYFRKTKKEASFFYELSKIYSNYAVSIITVFEVLIGSNDSQKEFWESLFRNMEILPFDEIANDNAVEIYKKLKTSGNLIEIPDLFIGATSLSNGLRLATLNKKHFSRIERLELITK